MVRSLKTEHHLAVNLTCRTLDVSRSGYYAWASRPESERKRRNRELTDRLRELHAESRGTYGAPRLLSSLADEGVKTSRKRVARLMREAKIEGVAKCKFRVVTTDSDHDLPVADRIFQTEEPATWPVRPNAVWAGDITYVATDEGWLYLSVFLDVFTRKIVGHAMEPHMRTNLITQSLEMALGRQERDSDASLVTHSDRGCQYASEQYRARLDAAGIQASMSRRGNCYDNAYVESFFHSLKVELIHRRRFVTREEARAAIFEYIEVWYNRRRKHSALGYLSPIAYEKRHALSAACLAA
jgi:transposase InsO family protein